jgi:hypothetical protein
VTALDPFKKQEFRVDRAQIKFDLQQRANDSGLKRILTGEIVG